MQSDGDIGGWTQEYDESGSMYYFNKETGESTWSPPASATQIHGSGIAAEKGPEKGKGTGKGKGKGKGVATRKGKGKGKGTKGKGKGPGLDALGFGGQSDKVDARAVSPAASPERFK